MDPLPIDAYIGSVVDALARRRAAVVVAEPGAGKTTRVPPALLDAGPALLLQPRRAAARAIARRIADERAWRLGDEVGWQVRFEHRFTSSTRLLVATEGILTARLQQDPLLSQFHTVILDEFHERSIHGDLGIALVRQAWLARDDLRVVVMSATIDADQVARFLEGCPVVRVPGTLHPVTISYAAGRTVSEVVPQVLDQTSGDVLCFLPGRREIDNAIADLRRAAPGVELLPLHGSLRAEEQERALSGVARRSRRVIVATNLAETSVTVPGVSAVVDAGLQKVARYDASRAIDSLVTERITQDAADQRAGRAARLGPGVVSRLWDARDRLRPHREADIHRIDLCGTLLAVAAWGGDVNTFEWFEPPRADTVEAAVGLLERLGAMKGGAISDVGRVMNRLPVHPRLGRILVAGRGALRLCQACALLTEQTFLPPRSHATTSDLLSALDDWRAVPESSQQLARDLSQAVTAAGLVASSAISDDDFRRALLAGYPDRVGRRRATGSADVKLASGAGAVLAAESGVHDAEFMVALDVRTSDRDPATGRIRLASAVEREWLIPTSRETTHRLDESDAVRAASIDRYEALVLSETPVRVDDEAAARLLARTWAERPRSDEDARLLRRLSFAGVEIDMATTIAGAAYGVRRLGEIRLEGALGPDVLQTLNRHAPERLRLPSGRDVLLEYGEDGSVSASAKLQELFGLAEAPRIGPRREPVVFSLLAPNGRPVQVTRDLRSFWNHTYPEVRKELRGRYPKHPWPDDPWSALPTARAKPRPKN